MVYPVEMLDFVVWDAPQYSASAPHCLTAIRGNGELAAVGVRRGIRPDGIAQLSIFSFSLAEYAASPDWPKRHALLDLLAGDTGVGVGRDVISERMEELSSDDGRPSSLTVDERGIAASRLDIDRISWLVWSNDPNFGIAVAGYDTELPDLNAVRLGDFDRERLAEIGM